MGYRKDIQAMRGIAVLLVLFFHAFPSAIPGGYLGVDVFFVISGFLITGHVLKSLEVGTFSLSDFFRRRIQRILPATLVTLFGTSVLAAVILTENARSDFWEQFVGALTLRANVVLWDQVGYFARASDQQLLLHMWSLSIEEQFYLVLPLVLVLLRNRLQRGVVLGLALTASLTVCLAMVSHSPSAVFYLAPTRAWELLAGSVLAWLNPQFRHRLGVFEPLPLLVIAVVALFPIDRVHPRLDALIVVVASVVLLAYGSNLLAYGVVARTLQFVGDISFSLYLIHWPLLSAARIIYLGEVPLIAVLFVAILSVFLAVMQYLFVEQSMRSPSPWRSRHVVVAGFAACMVLYLFGIVVVKPNMTSEQTTGHGKSVQEGICDNLLGGQVCTWGQETKVALWGDSYARQLIPALTRSPVGLISFTFMACEPLPGMARLTVHEYSAGWARSCADFNDQAIHEITSSQSIEVVVISTAFISLRTDDTQLVDYRNDNPRATPSDAILRFNDSVRVLTQAGKKVVIVSPLPSGGFDPKECIDRVLQRRWLLGRSDCTIERSSYEKEYSELLEVLRRLDVDDLVRVFWLHDLNCIGEKCYPVIDGVQLYRDAGHLSTDGSLLLGKRFNLPDAWLRSN